MAKAKTARASNKKKAAKPAKAAAAKSGGGKKKSAGKGIDALWKLAEHPLVGELLAAGAMAAVAAIADKGLGAKGKKGISSAAVKDAGKAAAAAIGVRLLSEFDQGKTVGKVSKPASSAKPKAAKAPRRAKPKTAKAAKPAKPKTAKP